LKLTENTNPRTVRKALGFSFVLTFAFLHASVHN
jgi:hypothetical protein